MDYREKDSIDFNGISIPIYSKIIILHRMMDFHFKTVQETILFFAIRNCGLSNFKTGNTFHLRIVLSAISSQLFFLESYILDRPEQ